MVSLEEQYIQDILRRLSGNFHGRLVFAGIIDEKAKLIHFQKGDVAFLLPFERQNALDVQISLMLSLGKQLEDFAGSLSHTVLSFHDCEIIIMEVLAHSFLYVICTKGAASDMTDMLMRLVEASPETRIAGRERDLVQDEWS